MNILILEDETYNFRLVQDILLEQMPTCNITGPITSVAEGRKYFANTKDKIDVIIADVELNDGLSFSALSEAPKDVPIIFTTAYEEHAFKAFHYNSLSYLLKPVDPQELQEAIRKTQERLITDDHREELFRMLSEGSNYRERINIKTFNGETVIHLSNASYFTTEQKRTFLYLSNGTSHAIDMSLSQLEEELNPKTFMRVNRQYIVALNAISRLEAATNGKERLILHGDNPPEIIISRDSKEKVHQWIY